jgi:hypothetical protein
MSFPEDVEQNRRDRSRGQDEEVRPEELDAVPKDTRNESRFERFFELDKHVVEDWFRCIYDWHPSISASIKFVFALNITAALIFNFVIHHAPRLRFFGKLTYLSNIGLVMYLYTMAWLGFRHGRCRAHWGPFRRFLLSELHFSCWMFQFLIPPIYWLALFDSRKQKNTFEMWWQNISVHGSGMVVLIVELLLARRWYLTWKDTIVNMVLILLYMMWMWNAAFLFGKKLKSGNFELSWMYDIYSFEFKYAPWSYLGTLVAVVIFSLAIVGVHGLKNRVSPKFRPVSC